MKKILVGLVFSFLLVVFGSHNSYAEKCDCAGRSADGMYEEGPPMMPFMKHHCKGMMQEMSGHEHPMWKRLMGLKLDEKQREAINDIKSGVMKEIVRQKADEHIARIELKDLLRKDSPDMKAVESKLRQIEALKTDIHLSLIKAREEVKSKLTPEQRKKFKQMPEPDHKRGHKPHAKGDD